MVLWPRYNVMIAQKMWWHFRTLTCFLKNGRWKTLSFPIDTVPHVEFSGARCTFKTSGGEDQLSTDVTVSKHWMCLVYWTTYCGSCCKKLLGSAPRLRWHMIFSNQTVVLGIFWRRVNAFLYSVDFCWNFDISSKLGFDLANRVHLQMNWTDYLGTKFHQDILVIVPVLLSCECKIQSCTTLFFWDFKPSFPSYKYHMCVCYPEKRCYLLNDYSLVTPPRKQHGIHFFTSGGV